MPAHAQSATYPLAQVQAVIKLARIGDKVIERTAIDYPEDPSRVAKFIRETIASLDKDAFVESKRQNYEDRDSVMADVYAIQNAEGSWYIKFYLEHGRVTVLSCHCPRHDIRRADGTVIKAQP